MNRRCNSVRPPMSAERSLPTPLHRTDFMVLLAAFLWGISFYFQKEAMAHVGPLLFNGLRGAIAALALLPLALRERQGQAAGGQGILLHGLAAGMVFLAAGVLQQAGIATATLTNTAFLTALYVVVTPFLLWLLRGKRPGGRIWFCAVLAFGGIWLLGGGTIGAFSRGDMLVAASALFWSLLMVVTSAAGRIGKPFQYTCMQFATVAAVALPLALLGEPVDGAAVAAALPSLLFVGAVGSALTYTIMAYAVQHIAASRAAILLSTEVLFASAAGHLMFGERLGLIQWAGAATLLGAVLLVQTARAGKPA